MAYCEARNEDNSVCGQGFATLHGCNKHEYRDGHNLDKRPYKGAKKQNQNQKDSKRPESHHTNDGGSGNDGLGDDSTGDGNAGDGIAGQ